MLHCLVTYRCISGVLQCYFENPPGCIHVECKPPYALSKHLNTILSWCHIGVGSGGTHRGITMAKHPLPTWSVFICVHHCVSPHIDTAGGGTTIVIWQHTTPHKTVSWTVHQNCSCWNISDGVWSTMHLHFSVPWKIVHKEFLYSWLSVLDFKAFGFWWGCIEFRVYLIHYQIWRDIVVFQFEDICSLVPTTLPFPHLWWDAESNCMRYLVLNYVWNRKHIFCGCKWCEYLCIN